jgi:hypothetical protein
MTPLLGSIAAKNYLPFARVLARSIREHHPDHRLVVVLADELDGVDRATEPFTLLPFGELGVPDVRDLAFRTEQREFSIALKPYFLAWLLEQSQSALFLDPDVLVLGPLDTLFADAEAHALTLVPHSLQPPATVDAVERELVLYRAGVYNGGVLGVRRDASVTRFLRWWQERVQEHCTWAVERGIHYDQRWLDLAIGFVEDTRIHRNPAVDVAHWNLPERRPPYQLFHFSGFDPDRPERPTRYRPELRAEDIGAAWPLFERYAAALREAGWESAQEQPYAYAGFSNGAPIPAAARRLYGELPERRIVGDPFGDDFFAWLADGSPNRLWQHIHRERPDLQRAFPRPQGRDRRRFLKWIRMYGMREHDVPLELA